MAACQDQEERLSLWAAGALEPGEEAQVRAHLEACPACQREAEATRELLGQVAPPPHSLREQAVLAALPRTAVAAWREEQGREAVRMRATGALLAAAAAVLLVLGAVTDWRAAPPPVEHTAPEVPLLALEEEEEPASELEQWALADPLAEALSPEAEEAGLAEDSPGPEVPALEDFLSY
jgi:anti-sigma factor RsiW